MAPYWLQGPQEHRDIAFDWSDRVDDIGSPQDVIASSSWDITPDVGSPSPTLTPQTTVGNVTAAILADLTVGVIFVVTNTIVTTGGRTHTRTATIRCDHK